LEGFFPAIHGIFFQDRRHKTAAGLTLAVPHTGTGQFLNLIDGFGILVVKALGDSGVGYAFTAAYDDVLRVDHSKTLPFNGDRFKSTPTGSLFLGQSRPRADQVANPKGISSLK
jgi:hypothetical protein